MQPTPPVSAARHDELRGLLLEAVGALHRKRAAEIGDAVIEDLVNLSWLEWAGGSLRLTAIGENICAQARDRQ